MCHESVYACLICDVSALSSVVWDIFATQAVSRNTIECSIEAVLEVLGKTWVRAILLKIMVQNDVENLHCRPNVDSIGLKQAMSVAVAFMTPKGSIP